MGYHSPADVIAGVIIGATLPLLWLKFDLRVEEFILLGENGEADGSVEWVDGTKVRRNRVNRCVFVLIEVVFLGRIIDSFLVLCFGFYSRSFGY